MTNYSSELEFAKALAYKAGGIMRKYLLINRASWKEDNSPLTEADLNISRLVKENINKHYPEYGFIDEEGQKTSGNHEYQWICDPIDGTIPYANNVPNSMFSLALVKSGKPVVGVCYDPFTDRIFTSIAESKAYLNDEEIQVLQEGLTKSRFLLALPYWYTEYANIPTFDYNTFYREIQKTGVILFSIESYVYSAMLVARGSAIAAILPSANAWDRAAAKIIVDNAGGITVDEQGKDLTIFGKHKLSIIGNKQVSAEIQAILAKCI